MAKAIFAAGCSGEWEVELSGRLRVCFRTRVGYLGGNFDNPTYKDVCTDQPGPRRRHGGDLRSGEGQS